MSLYSDYIKEREGKLTIETDKGFIVYKHYPSLRQMFICELYVVPEERRSGSGEFFMNHVIEIAQDVGCTHVACTTDTATNGWEVTHNALLSRNYKLVTKDGSLNLYYKDI